MVRLLYLILIVLLTGCSLHGEPSQSSIIVHPDRNGSIFNSVRWSPNGTQISYIKDGSLWVKNMKSGISKKMVSNSLVLRSTWVDSTNILYYINDGSGSLKGSLLMIDVNLGKISVIAKDSHSIQTISLFNKTIYLGEDKKGIRTLNLSELNNIQPNQLIITLENGTDIKVSPKGDKIAFLDWTIRQSKFDVKRAYLSYYDLITKQVEQFDQLKDFKIYSYCWSSNGNLIAFAGQSPIDKVPNIYIYKLGKDTEPAILLPSINAADLDWSPTNNQLIVESVGQPNQNDIRIVNVSNQLLH